MNEPSTPEALEHPLNLRLVSGIGNYDEGTACVMSAAVAMWRLRRGVPLGEATDELECACPVIRAWLIAANDANWWQSTEERTQILAPYVSRILDTKGSDEVTWARLWIGLDSQVRQVFPAILRMYGKAELTAVADKLGGLPPITRETVSEAIKVLEEAKALALARALALALDIDRALALALARARARARDLDLRGQWMATIDRMLEIKAT